MTTVINQKLNHACQGGSGNRPANYLPVTVDFTNATWNTVATHELFTVTGLVRIQLLAECTEDLAGGAGATISLGIESDTDLFTEAKLFSLVDAGEFVITGIADPANNLASSVLADHILNNSDIGYEIAVNALTDGTITYHLWWEPLVSSNPGSVVAGAGGVL